RRAIRSSRAEQLDGSVRTASGGWRSGFPNRGMGSRRRRVVTWRRSDQFEHPRQGGRMTQGSGPKLLSGGNPQIPKGDGDGPVQAYIAAMPDWKHDVGRRIDRLVVDVV